MSLRTRAIALSLLPLLITLVIAFPEGILQQRVGATAAQARAMAGATDAARTIEDASDALAVEVRRWAAGDATSALRYPALAERMRGAIAALQALAVADPGMTELTHHVSSSGARVLAEYDAIADRLRAGDRRTAMSALTAPRSLADAGILQQNVRAFVTASRTSELRATESVQRLGTLSLALLVLSLAGIAATSAFLWYSLAGAAESILELGRKAELYRNGGPLGAVPGARDEIGRLEAQIHEFVDVQRRRERELQRYRLLADVTHDIILFIDRADFTIIDANKAAITAYGYPTLVGRPSAILYAPSDPIDRATIAKSDLPEGLSYEGMHQRADGSVFPVEVHARTAEVEGRLMIVETIRDISERRFSAEQIALALDHAVEASRLKSEFVATMSHEIRTPMHGVIGMSELLLETQLMPLQREYAFTVKESAQALLTIIDDILDFSKLEANKVELETVAFDPTQLVNGALNLVRSTARDKGLRLQSFVSPHVPGAVRGDPTRVRQILINLIGNAVKFTENGEVTVSTTVARDDGRTVVLEFAVTDTGIGVAPEAREHLFEAFVQGDGSTTRRFGGTGLGLSICRRLIELMNGRIWLGEHEGPGATFCFTAPFERTAAIPPVAVATAGLRVLVLDDNATTRQTFEAMLSSWGMLAACAESIDEARALLLAAAADRKPFDIVLIDYVLPKGDGLTFAREVGAERAFGNPVRVLTTAFDAVGRKQAALAAGCAAYLTKPADPSDLYELLGKLERNRRLQIGSTNAQRRARILLVEDSSLIRRVARFQLSQLLYDVDIVENGIQAVAAVEGGEYELVLMDMRMPEMDGLDATRAIREAERATGAHVIVVALTANVLEGDREACVAAGMDDFLAKPLRLDALRVVLERWLPATA